DLRITTIYTSDEPETDRKKYFGKVEDLAQEVAQYNKKIKVEHFAPGSGNQKHELVKRVETKFGSSTAQYREVVDLARQAWAEYKGAVGPVREEIVRVLQGDSWLSGYSTLANLATQLKNGLEAIDETSREVEELTGVAGLPKYQEANNKIKSLGDDLKKHLEDFQKWAEDAQKLAQTLGDPQSPFATQTREKLQEMTALLADLKRRAGDPSDPNVPEDPKPQLQEFAKSAQRLANWLVEE